MTITVSDNALRDMIREALSGGSTSSTDDIVNVNNVVDPSAAETDPANGDYLPHSKVQFDVAVKNVIKDVPDETIPRVFRAFTDSVAASNDRDIEKDKKMATKADDKDKKVEEAVRKEIRKVLSEITPRFDTSYSGTDFGDSDEDEDEEGAEPKRKFSTMGDVGGASFEEIAKELGFSVAGAKQAVDKALDKAKFMQTEMDPDDLEILVLTSMNDYIKMLSKSGELSAADIRLMKDHPEIVRTLDGFREFLHNHIRRARKGAKLENPLGESVQMTQTINPNVPGNEPDEDEDYGVPPGMFDDEYTAGGEECPHCGGTNTIPGESHPSMLGYGTDQTMFCTDCDKEIAQNPLGVPQRPRRHESVKRNKKLKTESAKVESIRPDPKNPGSFLVHTGYDKGGPSFERVKGLNAAKELYKNSAAGKGKSSLGEVDQATAIEGVIPKNESFKRRQGGKNLPKVVSSFCDAFIEKGRHVAETKKLRNEVSGEDMFNTLNGGSPKFKKFTSNNPFDLNFNAKLLEAWLQENFGEKELSREALDILNKRFGRIMTAMETLHI